MLQDVAEVRLGLPAQAQIDGKPRPPRCESDASQLLEVSGVANSVPVKIRADATTKLVDCLPGYTNLNSKQVLLDKNEIGVGNRLPRLRQTLHLG